MNASPVSPAIWRRGVCLLLALSVAGIGHAEQPDPADPAADPAQQCYRSAVEGDHDPYPCDLAIRIALDAGDSGQAAVGYANRALILAAAGRLALALEDQRAALEQAPDDPRLLANLGSLLLQHGQPREALGHYHRLVTLRPDDPASYYNRAFAYRALGDVASAAADVEEAVRLQGHDSRRSGAISDTRPDPAGAR